MESCVLKGKQLLSKLQGLQRAPVQVSQSSTCISWVQRVKERVTGGSDKIPTRLLNGFTDTTGSKESELVAMRHMHLAETLISHRNEGGDSVSSCHPLKAG